MAWLFGDIPNGFSERAIGAVEKENRTFKG
jgi:hypothetical protein